MHQRIHIKTGHIPTIRRKSHQTKGKDIADQLKQQHQGRKPHSRALKTLFIQQRVILVLTHKKHIGELIGHHGGEERADSGDCEVLEVGRGVGKAQNHEQAEILKIENCDYSERIVGNRVHEVDIPGLPELVHA